MAQLGASAGGEEVEARDSTLDLRENPPGVRESSFKGSR